jgi:hypothetical protein
MNITRASPISGKVNTLAIDVTEEQLADWKRGTLIQNAMPNVSPEERDFILLGLTPDEWNEIFEADENE